MVSSSRLSSLAPGTILIMLSGKHKGKRVIYLGPHSPASPVAAAAQNQKAVKSLKFAKRSLHGGKKHSSYPEGLSRKKKAISSKWGAKKETSSKSGALLVVTGTPLVNGVPVRRINPRNAIATSTKVDLSNVSDLMPEVIGASSLAFAPSKAEKRKHLAEVSHTKEEKVTDALFVEAEGTKKQGIKRMGDNEVRERFVAAQRKINAAITKTLRQDPMLLKYLRSEFSLRSNMYPHEMKF